VVSDLTNTLWYLDPYYEKLSERCCHAPELFKKFKGYNDWRAQKRKAPILVHKELDEHIRVLGNMLHMPWLTVNKHARFKEALGSLLDNLTKYSDIMLRHAATTGENHARAEPVRSMKDNFAITAVKQDHCMATSALCRKLEESDFYQIVALDEFLPTERKDCHQFIASLGFPFPVSMMTYSFGNYLGNMYFVWKCEDTPHSQKEISAVNYILKQLPYFSTRTMRRQFLDRYNSVAKPHVLRNMWKFVTQDESSPNAQITGDLDERVAEFFMSTDEPDLIMDLRKCNGKTHDKNFDTFWDTLQRILAEKSVVHERRAAETNYLPDWISVRDLRDEVLRQCPANTAAPSEAWIRLNFHPSNPYVRSAAKYTSRFQVKYAVQQRMLRATHPDSKYCATQYKYLKQFCVDHKDVCHLISVDDKAIIPVGEPNLPVSTNVRRQHRSLVAENTQLLALDHDYHLAGVVPSILLNVIIPDNKEDSFHFGKLEVTVKDKIFQPSTANRHATETVKLLRRETALGGGADPERLDDGEHGFVDFAVPILITYSDGGPDHNNTFLSVQLAAVAIFVALDLDMYICARCAPCQSYSNPAERCMSTLNLSLQSVALSRSEMTDHFEVMMKKLNTLNSVRKSASRNSHLKDELTMSMEEPIDIVIQRFRRTTYGSGPTQVFAGASQAEIDVLQEVLGIFSEDQEANAENMKKKIKNFPKFLDFKDRHCRCRQYSFQIKKCTSDDCWYCFLLHPGRMAPDQFAELYWLPDPQKDEDGNWTQFTNVYGTETKDDQRPSLSLKTTSPADTAHKAVLNGGKYLLQCIKTV
jgi:hypothetical protein